MEPHHIELPQKIIIGRNIIEKIPFLCRNICKGKALVLTGPNTRGTAGEKVAGMFPGSSLQIVEEGSYSEVQKLRDTVTNIDFIICVGGGKVIDVGKLFALEKLVPYISVPTAPSHDGIASERASVTKQQRKYSVRARPPLAVIADIKILLNAPKRLIAAGAADVISNYSSVYDWKLAAKKGEYYSDYAASLALLSSEVVIKSAKLIRKRTERGIRNLVEALISSGISMSLAGSSRPASGSEHMFSHALDMLGSKALHGEQVGVGSIVTSFLQGQDWQKIRDSLRTVGAPITASELGVEPDLIVKAFVKAKSIRKRYTILNEKKITKARAMDACKVTGVF